MVLEGYARSGGCRSRAVQPHVKSSGHAALEPHCKARATTAPPVRWTSQRIPKSQHCTPHDARAVATAANGSKSICLGVLVNEGPRTLVATLASWRAKGLLDAVAERYMLVQGPRRGAAKGWSGWHTWAVGIGQRHGFDMLCSPHRNTNFMANVQLAEACTSPWFLFMEEDFMVSNFVSSEQVLAQLHAAVNMVSSGAAHGVRLRHIEDGGEPNHALLSFKNKHEAALSAEVHASRSTGGGGHSLICRKPFSLNPCPDCYILHYLGALGEDPLRFAPPCELWHCDRGIRGRNSAAAPQMYCMRTAAYDAWYPSTPANALPRYTFYSNNPMLWHAQWYVDLIRPIANSTDFKTFERGVQTSEAWTRGGGLVIARGRGIFRHQRWDRGRNFECCNDTTSIHEHAQEPTWAAKHLKRFGAHQASTSANCTALKSTAGG